MKRMLVLVMCLALLSGCGAVIDPVEETPAPAPEPTGVLLPEPEALEATETIRYELNYVKMALELPEGWDYAYVGAGIDDGEVHAEPAGIVGIRFWPTAAGEDGTDGALALQYYPDLFGVCGTGLKTEDITLGSGLTGSMGTYDNGTVWDFISFYNTPGSYAVINEGADAWWEEYGGQAMAILNSIRVGEELMTQSEAVTLAESVGTVDYNSMRADFDSVSGEWSVLFYKDYAAGGDQTVRITPDGEVRTEYGE